MNEQSQRPLTPSSPSDIKPVQRDQGQEKELEVRLWNLQQCICELVIKNQQLRELLESATKCSPSGPSEGSSAPSTFDSRFMVVAWISATRCLTVEILDELREIGPNIDAVLFGPGFVVAFIVLPALLRRSTSIIRDQMS